MRGLGGFLLEGLFPGLIAILFAFGIFVAVRKSWRERHQWAERPPARTRNVLKEIITLVAFVMFITVMLGISYSRFRFHYELWVLRAQDVQEIRIGNSHVTDRSSIELVVHDLKRSEWYAVKQGGWGDETDLMLITTSGDQWQMQVGYHFTQHGAVILRSSEPHGGGWAMGQVFSQTLPQTLEKLGAPLSLCDTVHGHPCEAKPASPKS